MIKVLIVDDSFVMRNLLADILNSDSQIEVVSVVKSGKEAIKKIPQIKPDVITLDLVMPGWDGLTTLRHIMEECPVPVIILSAHSREGADITVECLGSGAVGFILKPSGELSLDIEKVTPELLEAVKAAAKVDTAKINALVASPASPVKYKAVETDKIIVIGASTGGPQTLEAILSSLPPDFLPPIIIAQHMPSIEFTQSLANHLTRVCKLMVKIAKDNEIIARKKIYLVPGGYNMTLETQIHADIRENPCLKSVSIRVLKEKRDTLTPSIDTVMKSVAGIYKEKAIGIILTGMGNDGVEGMAAIKNSGGKTLVQDESSLIFGMPKAVIDRGCADSILPAGKIAGKIVELCI